MVLGLHRKALVGGGEARSFRHRPALQHALELEAKVIVQASRRVALDVIVQRLLFCAALRTPRLRSAREIAHLAIALQAIGHARRPAKCAPERSNCYRFVATLTALPSLANPPPPLRPPCHALSTTARHPK